MHSDTIWFQPVTLQNQLVSSPRPWSTFLMTFSQYVQFQKCSFMIVETRIFYFPVRSSFGFCQCNTDLWAQKIPEERYMGELYSFDTNKMSSVDPTLPFETVHFDKFIWTPNCAKIFTCQHGEFVVMFFYQNFKIDLIIDAIRYQLNNILSNKACDLEDFPQTRALHYMEKAW